jgi:hypothetical protein
MRGVPSRVSAIALRAELRHRYWLRLHGLMIGGATLLATWLTSHALLLLGMSALGLRYVMAILAGYGVYLLLVRWWARRLIERRENDVDPGADVGSVDIDAPGSACEPVMRSGEGGDFGGGGASGDFGDVLGESATSAGEVAGNVLEGAASADEGVVIAIPLAIVAFVGWLLLMVLGGLMMMFFGIEVLLAVAVELAFAYAAGRSAVVMAREGWLGAAWRLTRMPLLAILCGVFVLGWSINHWVPGAQSLPQAVKLTKAK